MNQFELSIYRVINKNGIIVNNEHFDCGDNVQITNSIDNVREVWTNTDIFVGKITDFRFRKIVNKYIKKMNINLLVICEKDHDDDAKTIIGIATSVYMADLMIEEYYGKENIKEISKDDIRDSNLEYSKLLEISGLPLNRTYRVTITLEWFELGKV